jgi:hypothetical protein
MDVDNAMDGDEDIRRTVNEKLGECFVLLNRHSHGSDLQGHLLATIQRTLAEASRQLGALDNAVKRGTV